jgi:oligoribonuclease NrnB/cAMP/cGMP phosphodiesterase (DHH superfamily)
MSKPYVIYHKNCADGIGAAWAVWNTLRETAVYMPMSYGMPLWETTGKDVILVDFSFKRDVMEDLLTKVKSLTIIDHHQTSFEDLAGLEHPNLVKVIDTSKSGAVLAWEFVKGLTNHLEEIPKTLLHIQDRDLWKFELEGTRELTMALMSYEGILEDPELFDKVIMQKSVHTLISEGTPLLRKYNIDIKALIKYAQRTGVIGGISVPVANIPYMYSSEAGNLMSVGHPFSATYSDTRFSRNFSLRSQKEGGMDVAKIAESYGGGGHKNAAGFIVKRHHTLAKF